MAENVFKNPWRALDITANIATAAANRNPKNVLPSLPEELTFYITGKALYLGNFVWIMVYKWNKKQQSYTHLQQKKTTIWNID